MYWRIFFFVFVLINLSTTIFTTRNRSKSNFHGSYSKASPWDFFSSKSFSMGKNSIKNIHFPTHRPIRTEVETINCFVKGRLWVQRRHYNRWTKRVKKFQVKPKKETCFMSSSSFLGSNQDYILCERPKFFQVEELSFSYLSPYVMRSLHFVLLDVCLHRRAQYYRNFSKFQ